MNTDPSRLETNPYAYASGNPILIIDPSGLRSILPCYGPDWWCEITGRGTGGGVASSGVMPFPMAPAAAGASLATLLQSGCVILLPIATVGAGMSTGPGWVTQEDVLQQQRGYESVVAFQQGDWQSEVARRAINEIENSQSRDRTSDESIIAYHGAIIPIGNAGQTAADIVSATAQTWNNMPDQQYLGRGLYAFDNPDAASRWAHLRAGQSGQNVLPVIFAIRGNWATLNELDVSDGFRVGIDEPLLEWDTPPFDVIIHRSTPISTTSGLAFLGRQLKFNLHTINVKVFIEWYGPA